MGLAKEWNKATRAGMGGIHIYIPKDTVDMALEAAGILPGETQLMARATWFHSHRKGRARVLIELVIATPPEPEVRT